MSKLFNSSSFIAFLLIIIICFGASCVPNDGKLPASYYTFPIDTTVQIIQSFPNKVNESSGIIFFNEHIWSHNDSGDDPVIYELSIETGKILQQITFENAEARDWEDIAQDSQFVYVSDMGNNAGKRKDLAIYKAPKKDIIDGDQQTETFKINVTYPDRTNFKPQAYKHNFDCEAILATEDSLYVFSKNHLDNHCRLYSLANNVPNQVANLKDRFDTKGKVTGAAFSQENKVLALLGYNLDPEAGYFGPFVWLFWDFQNHDFFKGKSKRINLPVIAQAEGIAYWKNGQFLISTEKSRIMQGKLMVFDSKRWLK